MTALCSVDVGPLADWLAALSFSDWPQQKPQGDGQLRPAMVTDLAWHDFGRVTQPVVHRVMAHLKPCTDWQRMLSVVMPGHYIEPHRDEQPPYWRTRIHVPIVTNEHAWIIIEGVPHRFDVGFAYEFDTRKLHSIVNNGTTPRVHLMWDCWAR